MQPPDVISNSIDAFRVAAQAMQGSVLGYAKALFVSLAVIGGCWDALILAGERADITSWGVAFMRRCLWFLTFWMLLLYGPQWTTEIVKRFQLIGQSASGVQSVSPGAILASGADVSSALLQGSAQYGFLNGQFTVGLILVIAAVGIRFAFALIALQVGILLVLWYVVGSLGVIFLGFGGSRWTAPYTERYFSMAVSIGLKFLTMMFVVGIAIQFGPLLLTMAQAAPGSANPGGVALEILSDAGLIGLICWQVPKVFATMMGGSPALGAGEFWAGVSALATGGLAATGLAMAGAGAVAGAGRALSSRSGGSSAGASAAVGSVSSAGSSSVAPPGGGSGGGSSASGGNGNGGGKANPHGWTGPGSPAFDQAQAANGGGESSAPASSGDSGGSSGGGSGAGAPASPGGSNGKPGGNGNARAGARASRAVSRGQQALRGLGDDGGGNPPSPLPMNFG